MSDIHELHKKLVEESGQLIAREKELQQKISQAKQLREQNKERAERITKLEEELRELVEE